MGPGRILAAVLLALVLTGCASTDPGIVNDVLAEARSALDALRVQAEREQERIAGLDDEAERTRAEAALAELREQIEAIEQWRARVEAGVDERGELEPAAAGDLLARALPAPWGTLLGILVGGVGTWWKMRGTRAAFVRLVAALNTAKQRHPGLAIEMDRAGGTIRTALGPEALARVEASRRAA